MSSEIKEKYECLKVLGQGSFGTCYKMLDLKKKIHVCVKVVQIKNMPQKDELPRRWRWICCVDCAIQTS